MQRMGISTSPIVLLVISACRHDAGTAPSDAEELVMPETFSE
jgi:hypothetical protein